MNLFLNTIKYRLKSLCTTTRGIVFFVLGLLIAISPFIGLIVPDAPIPIGWIDDDKTSFSELLKQNVEALDVVCIFEKDEKTLMANLQTGKIEGVFVVKHGFEEAIKNGDFEESLMILKSPYSTAAGVISESVGGEAMRLWLSCYSAKEAGEIGGINLYNEVFKNTNAGTNSPIISLVREGRTGQIGAVTPIKDAAFTSLYLLAAFACFYMLTGLAVTGKNLNFAARLKSRGFSLARYRLSASISKTIFILPCVIPALIGFGVAGASEYVAPIIIMFILYLLAYGGIASLIAQMRNQTAQMLIISVVTVANVLFGSLLVSLPSGGEFQTFTYLLPSRWLSSIESLGAFESSMGLIICAFVYQVLPFIIRKKEI